MADLIPPHGGLTEPVSRTVPANEVQSFQSQAAALPKVAVSQADLSTVYRIADGTLSPLTGPMNRQVYNRVLDESVIEHGGKLYAWTIPLAFPVTKDVAATLATGKKVAITAPKGKSSPRSTCPTSSSGTSRAYLKSVYGTERTDHPAPTWPEGRRRQNAPRWRRDPRAAAAQESRASVTRPHAARSRARRQERLERGRRLPDPQPVAPRSRICPGLRHWNC